MTDRKQRATAITATKELEPTPPPTVPIQADIFKPLGSTTVGNVVTRSYAAEVGNKLILKTVTTTVDGQSESLLSLQGMKLVPTSVDGFYKVV